MKSIKGANEASKFNKKYPVGSTFIYQPFRVLRGGKGVKTESKAFWLGGGDAYVKVTGISDIVTTNCLTPAGNVFKENS
jgi:hypothetical protein